MIGRIIIGLILVGVGALIVMKSEWLMKNVGAIPWAEQHMGTEGGSRLLYKLIGILIIIAGFLIMTNLMTILLASTIGKLFKSARPI